MKTLKTFQPTTSKKKKKKKKKKFQIMKTVKTQRKTTLPLMTTKSIVERAWAEDMGQFFTI